jgi:iron complex transport system substrate-binding protein
MEIKHPWLMILAILIIIVAGCAFVEVLNMPAAGNTTATVTVTDDRESGGGSCHGNTGTCTLLSRGNVSYRTITDMAGRTVIIPANITMVLSTSPPPTSFVYMLAPDKLGGWQSSPSTESRKYIPKKYWNITVLSWSPINYEAYIALHPDLVFVGCESGISDSSAVNLTQEKFGTIPVVCVDNARNATGYGPTLTFMGEVLGVPEVAKQENAYYSEVLGEVESKVSLIPAKDRTRVYYAEGNDGLSTDISGSPHSQLIDVCGGINVGGSNATGGSVSSSVTKESVLMWKPDVIITTSSEFMAQVYNDSTWQQVPAVRNHRVYLTPSQPNNWFDRPPGVNRIVGIPWTAHLLYPDLFPDDWMREKVKEFYSVFYHYNLTDDEFSSLLDE